MSGWFVAILAAVMAMTLAIVIVYDRRAKKAGHYK